jgi:CHAT domain-containing protein
MNLHMFQHFYTKSDRSIVVAMAGPLNQIMGNLATALARKSPSIGGLGGLLTLLLTLSAPLPVLASPDISIKQGQQQYNQGQYKEAIATWKQILNNDPSNADRLLLHQNLAQAHRQLGQTDSAIEQWETLIQLARKQSKPHLLTLALIEQAQTYSALGRTRTAIQLLCNLDKEGKCDAQSALTLARALRDPKAESAALGSLGDTHRLLGEYNSAATYLKSALQLAQTTQNKPYQLAALHSLGNNAYSLSQRYQRRALSLRRQGELQQAKTQQTQAQTQTAIAQDYFQQALTLATDLGRLPDQIKARLSLKESDKTQLAAAIAQLPPSRDRLYSTIDLAEQTPNPEPLLTQSIRLAQTIDDPRGESFALGALGKWQEKQGNYAVALATTHKAILAADRASAKDSRYQWEWQMARLLRAQNNNPAAISAYEQSIATMESIRSDLLKADRNLQFDFRDSVEPIYRELIDLRFQTNSPAQLTSALGNLDALRLAELQNYFGSDCLIRASEQAKPATQDSKTAIVRSVILADRLINVLSIPGQPERITTTAIPRQQLETEITALRQQLETYYNPFNPAPAQTLYKRLIEPFSAELKAQDIDTLVFVNDGILRSLPMAALHDGQGFLIERYAIATTPSLSLTNMDAGGSTNRALAAGMTQDAVIDGRRFRGLTNVAAELQGIQSILPGSQILQDADFTEDRMGVELKKTRFPIIHLATHGKFGAEAEDTFLVLGNQQKLSLTQLDSLIRRVSGSSELIDLLTLTACETAVGDDRAALGLAGIAIQAGAKSVIASLWSINDATTRDFSQSFYQNLKTSNKAKALQATQIKMIRTNSIASRPAYWAPYVLVGSWR